VFWKWSSNGNLIKLEVYAFLWNINIKMENNIMDLFIINEVKKNLQLIGDKELEKRCQKS